MSFDGYDENEDPVQHGVVGYQQASDGVTHVNGLCLGIVLSVNYSDSNENLYYKFLNGDDTNDLKGPYLEASVLVFYAGDEVYSELDNVPIAQGKSSSYGPSSQEPADWSEDVPNGCTASELEAFFGDSGASGLETLSGDRVIIGFLGGVFQTPIILNWFPSPNNKSDAARKEDGKRYLLRRNNSEFQIDQNGDLHLTHRVGQYLQMKGESITLKHRQGQIVHLDEDGSVEVKDKSGNSILSDEKGWVVNSGGSRIEIRDGRVMIVAQSGSVDVISDKVNLIGNNVRAHGGGVPLSIGGVSAGGIRSLCNDELASDFALFASSVSELLLALPPPANAILLKPSTVDPTKTMGEVLGEIVLKAQAYGEFYLTRVLKAE